MSAPLYTRAHCATPHQDALCIGKVPYSGREGDDLSHIFNVPNRCIDEVVEELNFISGSTSGPIIKEILQSCLEKHNCQLDVSVISKMVTELCEFNPISLALKSDGPVYTAYKKKMYFKENFSVVELV